MNLRNTNDIKKAVLQKCGELTNGSSPYDTIAVAHINKVYKALFGGGDIFNPMCSEPWPWAMARRPIVLRIDTEITTGSLTLTSGSFNGVLSQVPQIQLQNTTTLPNADLTGWYLKIPQYDDYFRIRYHVPGTTTFQLDQAWFDGTMTTDFTLFNLEYDLYDDAIVVDGYSLYLDFNDGTAKTAQLLAGVYSSSAFITMVITQLGTVSSATFNLTYNSITRMFSISSSSATFQILGGSGTNAIQSGWKLMGFGSTDYTGSQSYTPDHALNAIQRLIAPINVYKNASPRYIAPEDSGKIYGIDLNSMYRKYPLLQIYPFYPDKFCELSRRDNGAVRIRLNTYPREAMRAEVSFIPVAEVLYDNVSSVPKITEPYRTYLVSAAAYYLATDKSDDRADKFAEEAKGLLASMINDYRSNTERTNNTYGKVIPRAINYSPWRTLP